MLFLKRKEALKDIKCFLRICTYLDNVLGANKVFHDPFRGNLFLYEMHHLERDEALFELGED